MRDVVDFYSSLVRAIRIQEAHESRLSLAVAQKASPKRAKLCRGSDNDLRINSK